MKRSWCKVRASPKGWLEHDIQWVWPNGESARERRQCPRQSPGAAAVWAKEREREVYALGPPSTRKESSRMTWAKFWPEFQRLHFVNGPRGELKPSQKVAIDGHWRNYIQPFWGWRNLDDTSKKLITEWLATLQAPREVKRQKEKRPLEPKSINNVIYTFNTMLERAERWEFVAEKLPRAKALRMEKPDIDFYTFDEFDRLLEGARSCSKEAELVILLGARAGLRAGEIQGLRVSDLQVHKNEILVQRSVWKDFVHAPKSGHSRRVPVSGSLAELIRSRPSGYVLTGKKGAPKKQSELRALVRAAERAAGFPDPKGALHRLRHTFASHLVMRGLPLKVLQALLGHEDIKDTMRYAHLSPEALDDAVRMLHGDDVETTPKTFQLTGKS